MRFLGLRESSSTNKKIKDLKKMSISALSMQFLPPKFDFDTVMSATRLFACAYVPQAIDANFHLVAHGGHVNEKIAQMAWDAVEHDKTIIKTKQNNGRNNKSKQREEFITAKQWSRNKQSKHRKCLFCADTESVDTFGRSHLYATVCLPNWFAIEAVRAACSLPSIEMKW